jgi:hypothetical protein
MDDIIRTGPSRGLRRSARKLAPVTTITLVKRRGKGEGCARAIGTAHPDPMLLNSYELRLYGEWFKSFLPAGPRCFLYLLISRSDLCRASTLGCDGDISLRSIPAP